MVHTLSTAAAGQGLPDQAEADRMLAMITSLGLEQTHPMLALVEPGYAMISDNSERAKAAMEKNLSHPDPWARAMLNLMSAVQAENDGDSATLEERLPLALAGFREIGDRWGIGTSAGTLANLYSAQGKVEEAIGFLQEARELMTELHASDDESYALIRIGMLKLRLDDLAGARQDVEAALEISVRTGSVMSSTFGTFSLGILAHLEGRNDEARRLALQALDQIERAPVVPPQIKAMVHCGLGSFDISDGKLEEAAEWLAQSFVAAKESTDMPIAAALATVVADLQQARGNPTSAAELLGAGIRLRGMDDLSDPEVLRVASAVQARMDPEDYARHHETGRNLSRDEALALLESSI